MSSLARVGVLALMGLAILVARLVEVELRPEASPPAAAAPAPALLIGGAAIPAVDGEPRAEPPPPSPTPTEPEGRSYIVRSGDTLGTISQKAYGTTRHWALIQDANRDVIPDPRKMRPGIRLRIPDLPARERLGR